MITIKRLLITVLCFNCALLLSGCPWGQREIYPDETATVRLKEDSLCFSIPNVSDYRPVFLSINPRNTPSKEKKFIDKPDIEIIDGTLCIPPALFSFSEMPSSPYIVEFTLKSESSHPRHFVAGVEIRNHKAYELPLTDREILRPYG